jgi:alkylated DNA repair protein (DNA oxidative demethylase)
MIELAPGLIYLPGFYDRAQQEALVADLRAAVRQAPLFTPRMPRTGKAFSVRMTNCGTLGWVSDQARGYRYQPHHPRTGEPWPALPNSLLSLWKAYAGADVDPDACLINVYRDGARMGPHRDLDEADRKAPVLSISLGDTALFRIGGPKRGDPTRSFRLSSGDICVLGGEARMAFHGVDRTLEGSSTLIPGGGRLNLTLRRAA